VMSRWTGALFAEFLLQSDLRSCRLASQRPPAGPVFLRPCAALPDGLLPGRSVPSHLEAAVTARPFQQTVVVAPTHRRLPGDRFSVGPPLTPAAESVPSSPECSRAVVLSCSVSVNSSVMCGTGPRTSRNAIRLDEFDGCWLPPAIPYRPIAQAFTGLSISHRAMVNGNANS